MPANLNPYSPPAGDELASETAPGKPVPFLYAIAAVLCLGLISLGCWLFEVIEIKGWAGLAWVHGFPIAALPICICVALSVAIPVLRRTRPPLWRIALFVVLGAMVGLVAFSLSLGWSLNERWPGAGLRPRDVLISPLASIALTAMGMHVLIRLLLGKISHWNLLLMTVAPLLIVGLSLATIEMVPAINGSRDFVHAVKMGYPMFWANPAFAAASALGMAIDARSAPRNRIGPAA